MSPEEKIAAIYALEVNASIDWFWDGGYRARLGDKTNGFIDESDHHRSFSDAVDWLYERVNEEFPGLLKEAMI